MAAVKPIGKIKVIGKRGTDVPFPIPMQKGLYLYIPEAQAKRLEKINEAYRSTRGREVATLDAVKIIGRGGAPGYRSFLLKGYSGRYVCILADHLRQLQEINEALKKKPRKKKPG
jgi:hypothetical protein